MHKILKKFSKEFFMNKNNHLHEMMTQSLHHLKVTDPEEATQEWLSFRKLFANHFYQGDKHKARLALESHMSRTPVEEVVTISFLCGMIAALIVVLTFFLVVPDQSNSYHLNEIRNIFPIYRAVLCFSLVILAGGFIIKLFRRYRVNYIYILELDTSNWIWQNTLYQIGLALLAVWCLCFIGQVSVIKHYVPFTLDIFAVILLFGFLALLFNPFNFMYRSMWGGIFTIIAQNMLAPFHEVRFRHFFLADYLTSLVKPIIDCAIILCYLQDPQNLQGEGGYKVVCSAQMPTALAISYIPFHMRFFQCWWKYFETRQAFPHLVNAGKYGFSILTIFLYN